MVFWSFERRKLAISRTVGRSQARRHSIALHKTHPKHLSELNIKVTCEVKVMS